MIQYTYPVTKQFDGLIAYFGTENGGPTHLRILQGSVERAFFTTASHLEKKLREEICKKFATDDFSLCRWSKEGMTIYGINLDGRDQSNDQSAFTYLIVGDLVEPNEIPAILHCFPDIEAEFVRTRNKWDIDEQFYADNEATDK